MSQPRISLSAFLALFLALLLSLSGCGGSSGSGGANGGGGGSTALSISGASSFVLLGMTVQFTANQTVSAWTVNGISGGNSTVGTISSSGLYTAPTVLPTSTAITIGATSSASSATAALTITSDVAISLTASSSANPILTSSTVNLTASITSAGAPSTAITWTVNGVVNGGGSAGSITPGANGTAVYTAPNGLSPTSVQIVATSVADTTKTSSLSRTVQPIVLSSTSATPGSVITMTGTFGTQPVNFTLTDNLNYNFAISVTPTTSTTLSFTVPIYVNASQQIAQGSVLINAAQSSTLVKGGSLTIASSIPLTIGALPAAPGNPGDVTNAVLSSLSSLASDVQYNFDLIATASKGAVQSTAIDTATADQISHLNSAMASISSLAAGGSAISIGTSTYGNVQLTAANLSVLDSVLQAFVVNNPSLGAMFRSLPEQQKIMLGLKPDGIYSSVPAFSLAGIPAQTIADQVASFNQLVINVGVAAGVVSVLAGSAPLALAGAIFVAVDVLANAAGTAGLIAISSAFPTQQSDTTAYNNYENNVYPPINTSQGVDKVTQSNDFDTSSKDAETEMGDMNPGSTTSLWSTITNTWSTIKANLPNPPSATSVPSFSVASTYGSSGGPILVNLLVTNAPPDAQYIATGSWTGGTSSVPLFADGYGHDTSTLVIPASVIGTSSCYSGTITFTNYASGAVVNTISGCWGPPATANLYFLLSCFAGNGTASVNGVSLGTYTTANVYQVCNVPIGKNFTFNYTVAGPAYTCYPNTTPGVALDVTNATSLSSTTYSMDSYFDDELLPLSGSVTVQASCPSSGCYPKSLNGTAAANACVAIPGVNQ